MARIRKILLSLIAVIAVSLLTTLLFIAVSSGKNFKPSNTDNLESEQGSDLPSSSLIQSSDKPSSHSDGSSASSTIELSTGLSPSMDESSESGSSYETTSEIMDTSIVHTEPTTLINSPSPIPNSPSPAPSSTSTRTTARPTIARPTSPPTTQVPTTAHPTSPPTTQVQLVSPDGRSGAALNTPYMKNGILLLNKQHWVNENYAPLPAEKNKWSLQADAWQAWKEMEAAAQAEGLTLRFVSGYRTYAYQEELFNSYAARDPEGANRYSARAGQSEHQSGLALDMDNGIGKTGLTEAFADTAEGKWLWANAYKHGWILRYPRGKEHITGYIFEPWHYRYVGRTVAADFGPNSNLTLEEYLNELPSQYP